MAAVFGIPLALVFLSVARLEGAEDPAAGGIAHYVLGGMGAAMYLNNARGLTRLTTPDGTVAAPWGFCQEGVGPVQSLRGGVQSPACWA